MRPDPIAAPPQASLEQRRDGTMILRSTAPLPPVPRCIGDALVHWAQHTPERMFLAEQDADGRWNALTYAQALERVMAIGTWLVDRGLSAERPVAVLSDNSIGHAMIALAAMHVGVPVASISPAYSLASQDLAKLKACVALLEPGVVYVEDAALFGRALDAIAGLADVQVVSARAAPARPGTISLDEAASRTGHDAVGRAFAAVGPDTIAKFLFTSGSTAAPKAVINTQRMLCVNQAQKGGLWPLLRQEPPVLVDWLPWNHTFGGNHNFNMVLTYGGTLYIDRGKPSPGPFDSTLAALREISPTQYFNVPRGYDLLVPALQRDEALRCSFFARLRVMFYGGAALPEHLWQALRQLAAAHAQHDVMLVTGWGSTETAPVAADCHFQAAHSGNIGVPVPGCELKLVPAGDKLEVRVRGPQVTPGYWKQPGLTAAAFDDEGFYRIGDAVRLADPGDPSNGLVFDGRVAEDFKLTSGTWVSTGALRVTALAALAPVALDIVVAGHGRDEVGFLVFPNLAECRRLCPSLPPDAPPEGLVRQPEVMARLRSGLENLRRQAGGATSRFASRALMLPTPPAIDAGEITDKGYLNQRAVLSHRADDVARLFDPVADAAVVVLGA